MNIFETHSRIVSDYASYISSFIKISDPDIQRVVKAELGQGKLWPEPLLQFNPAFEIVGGIGQIAVTLPENDRVRYTISPTARKEVLRRLLTLNHERHAQEENTLSFQAERKKIGRKKQGPVDSNKNLFA